ncbi:MAG: uroporphyrinogen-III synthase [Marinicella sp.]|nr:uroporphyrinogen-III synthase [Xanthomonadales bacterium]
MTTVIITRPKPALTQAKAVYRKAGFEVFESPCFDIITNIVVKPEWLLATAEVWVVLSVHALQHALQIVPELKPASETRVIAVGTAVAKAWQKHFNQEIEYHPLQNSEGVVALLQQYQPKSIKILTTGDGRDVIKSYCMSQQISYSQINTYQRDVLPMDNMSLTDLYHNPKAQPVILTATSVGILQQFVFGISDELSAKVKSQLLVVGAQRIADCGRDLGFKQITVAESPNDQAMCAAIVDLVNTQNASGSLA